VRAEDFAPHSPPSPLPVLVSAALRSSAQGHCILRQALRRGALRHCSITAAQPGSSNACCDPAESLLPLNPAPVCEPIQSLDFPMIWHRIQGSTTPED
jgi:hypothetical protein